jgi:hypothetical protein
MKKLDITQEELKSELSYDPDTGEFIWLRNTAKVRKGGKAGCIDDQGYVRIHVRQRKYAAHRLAVLYITGRWPDAQVDHINGVRDENRWINLREVTKTQNMWNQKRRSTNTSGCPGVSFHKKNQNYISYIRDGEKRIYLGSTNHIFEAAALALSAKNRIHGEFARHG